MATCAILKWGLWPRNNIELARAAASAGADALSIGECLVFQVPGPEGPIPVVGVRSSSYMGRKPTKRAHYHIYDFEPGASGRPGARFRVTMRVRAYDPGSGRFQPEGEGWTRMIQPSP